MKKIYNILLAVLALFAFAPVVSAQSINDVIKDPVTRDTLKFPNYSGVRIDTTQNFAYSKSISSPQNDGTYWIKLESFSTGTASYKMVSEPADIVLVLDFSSSMVSYNYTTSGSNYVPAGTSRAANYNGNGNPAGSWDYQNLSNGRYVEYQGNHYEVERARVNAAGEIVTQGQYYIIYFTINGTRYYLDHYNITTEMPLYTNQYQAWWGSILYELDNNGLNRLQALKIAVKQFIDVIYHNDNYEDETNDKPRAEPLGNRISIVRYSRVARSRVVKDWTPVSTASGDLDLSIALAIAAESSSSGGSGTNNDNQTHADEGMRLANGLLKEIMDDETDNPDRWANASRTVVMFTDGAPGEAQNWTDPVSTDVANDCIEYAQETKTTYGSTVFSVLVYNGTPSNNMINYLNGVSSNYPLANAIDDLGVICTSQDLPEKLRKKEANFYKNAGDDLSGVFEEIAKQSGGGSETALSTATSTVDIVSNSFILPPGATADSIKVFIAQLDTVYLGTTKDQNRYVFKKEILKGHSPYQYYTYDDDDVEHGPFSVDDSIKVVLFGKNGIKVTGFDYSYNWCGPVYNENNQRVEDHKGLKIIMMIPIRMNPDAVGGPNVLTNEQGSGIFVNPTDTIPAISFVSPTVSLPVNVYLEKTGLHPGESAKFKIERAVIPYDIDKVPADWDPKTLAPEAWNYVSTVFVTNPEDSLVTSRPMVKVRGLPATTLKEGSTTEQVGFIYRISEETWGWSYIQATEPQFTVTSKVDNPFTFENTKKPNIEFKVRHAESKVTNIFKPDAATKEYDDSNKRQ